MELRSAPLENQYSQLMEVSEKGLDAATIRLGVVLIENEGEPHSFLRQKVPKRSISS